MYVLWSLRSDQDAAGWDDRSTPSHSLQLKLNCSKANVSMISKFWITENWSRTTKSRPKLWLDETTLWTKCNLFDRCGATAVLKHDWGGVGEIVTSHELIYSATTDSSKAETVEPEMECLFIRTLILQNPQKSFEKYSEGNWNTCWPTSLPTAKTTGS